MDKVDNRRGFARKNGVDCSFVLSVTSVCVFIWKLIIYYWDNSSNPYQVRWLFFLLEDLKEDLKNNIRLEFACMGIARLVRSSIFFLYEKNVYSMAYMRKSLIVWGCDEECTVLMGISFFLILCFSSLY